MPSQKAPLRTLSPEEVEHLNQVSHSRSAPVGEVTRAKELLLVAQGHTFTAAARLVGRASGDAVAHLVARFNREGVAALVARHGGGPRAVYDALARQHILETVQRAPEREQDGTARWSLTTLQRALRRQGLPHISTYTIWCVLQEAGLSWQKDRSWCATGTAQRVRHRRGVKEVVTVIDPDAEAKKS